MGEADGGGNSGGGGKSLRTVLPTISKKHNRLTSGELLSNDRRAVDFFSS